MDRSSRRSLLASLASSAAILLISCQLQPTAAQIIMDESGPPITQQPVPAPTAALTGAPTTKDDTVPDIVNAEDFALLELDGQLNGSSLSFKFNQNDARAGGQDTISVLLEVPVLAWAGWGISDNGGFMIGGEAVIGVPSTGEVLKYNLKAKNGEGVVPMSDEQQTLIDARVQQVDGSTILSFTKILIEEGEIPINIEDDNTFLSAWGFGNNLGIHAARGSFTLDGEQLETRKQNLWKVHGWLAAIAWAFLSPMAIACSVWRQFFPVEGLWFKLHRVLNMMVATFTIAAFGVAVVAINQETPEGAEAGHFDSSLSRGHRTIGFALFILALLQAIGGIMRPRAPAPHSPDVPPKANEEEDDNHQEPEQAPPDAERTPLRLAWEIGHRALGLGLLGFCWYQVYLGIDAYATIFEGGDTGSMLSALYACIGTFTAILLVGYGLKFAPLKK